MSIQVGKKVLPAFEKIYFKDSVTLTEDFTTIGELKSQLPDKQFRTYWQARVVSSSQPATRPAEPK